MFQNMKSFYVFQVFVIQNVKIKASTFLKVHELGLNILKYYKMLVV